MIADGTAVVVFLGPTCAVEDACRILPNAIYLPPVKCGDVLQALRLEPHRIVIIDGVFREVPSVWHKEILLAIERGVEVWGAASMGALRAAELAAFGMRGFGAIYQDYRDGLLTDDDEVALLFGKVGDRYLCVSDAMVNIRATIAKALAEAVVQKVYAEDVLVELKRRHYADRRLETYLEHRNDAPSRNLLSWLQQGNRIDVKRDDALGLLAMLRETRPANSRIPLRANRTLALRRMSLQVMTAPLDFEPHWLSEAERMLQSYRGGRVEGLLRRLAYFLALFDGLLDQLHIAPPIQSMVEQPFSEGVAPGAIDAADEHLRAMVARLNHLLAHSQGRVGATTGEWTETYRACLKLEGLYEDFKRMHDGDIRQQCREAPVEYRAAYLLSRLWKFHEDHLAGLGLAPHLDRVIEQTIEMRRSLRLHTAQDMESWMARNDLNAGGVRALMTMECNYQFLVKGGHFEHLGFLEPTHDRCWFHDAVNLVDGPIAKCSRPAPEGRARVRASYETLTGFGTG